MLNIITFSPEYLKTEATFHGQLDNVAVFEEGVPLEIFPNTELSIVWENPLFLVDEISVEFSLTFDVPASPSNLEIFNRPDRINIKNKTRSVPAIIMQDGLIISKGELIFVSYYKDITLQYKGAIDVIYENETLRQINIGETSFDVSRPTMPWHLDYTSADWNNYNGVIANRSSQAIPMPYVIGVVKNQGTEWDGHEAYRGIYNSFIKYINYFNPRDQRFSLDDPVKVHTPVVPFLSLAEVISKIFRESGEALQSNPFTSTTSLNKVVVVGVNHVKYNIDNVYGMYSYVPDGPDPDDPVEYLLPITDTEIPSQNMKWKYANFMQNFEAIEFVKDILKIFSLTLYRGTTYSIEFKNDVFEREIVVSWDDKLHDNPEISIEKGKDYLFSYGASGQEIEDTIYSYDSWQDVYDAIMELPTDGPGGASGTQYLEEFFYKVKGFPQVLAVTKTMRGINPDHPWLTSRIAKSGISEPRETIPYIDDTEVEEGDIVLFNNFEYLVLETHTTNESSNPPNDSPELYELIVKREEDFAVSSGVKPLDMSIEKYWWLNHSASQSPNSDVIQKEHWHVPVLEKGKSEAAPAIMLWAGRKPTFHGEGDEYPYLTNHHTDAQGNKIFDFSLLPGVKDGIVDVFHKRMKEWVEKDKLLLKAQFVLSAYDIKKINMRDKILLNGKKFFIRKIEFSLSVKGISRSDVELIEA
jgi:hypothetical protein